jgi:hypothetical protein
MSSAKDMAGGLVLGTAIRAELPIKRPERFLPIPHKNLGKAARVKEIDHSGLA